ncbi:MAG: NAD(P)/FAD-dependent oxidoreductase [Pseudomonadota bacterium]
MQYQTVIIGAGAAGLMCAAQTGPGTLLLDHAKAPGEKIRISGGGRCNFTNLYAAPENFLSANPHFCKSALSRYTQWDFIAQVSEAGIAYHEKTLGQLFCDEKSVQITQMLRTAALSNGADLWLETTLDQVEKTPQGYSLRLTRRGKPLSLACANLVIATGGKSIPKIGATDFGYKIAQQFDLAVTPTRAGLVPLTFSGQVLEDLKAMAGISAPARVSANGASFDEGLLFTHRGLSGPTVLQISSYWNEGDDLRIHFAPDQDIIAALKTQRGISGRITISKALSAHLPAKLAQFLCENAGLSGNLADQNDGDLARLKTSLDALALRPAGTEGYRTAEVTLGGVNTDQLNARTLETKAHKGLYFIGEVVDVTGWLGGYNFQWAWSSAWAAGQAIRQAGQS